ncbi:MAG: hypothetical protein RLZZ303_2286 [Candidatus Hydrogenedentota bacterium]
MRIQHAAWAWCLVAAGIVCAGTAHAQAKGTPGCTDSVSGSFDAESPRWDRVFESSGAPNLACNLSTFDSSIDQSPYRAFPFHGNQGGTLSVSFDAESTTLPDTTLYIYCASFDPAAPWRNLVAYSDDTPGSLLSGFSEDYGLTLVDNQTYWLVVSTYNGDSEAGSGYYGDFKVCLDGGYVFGEAPSGEDAPLSCPLDASYSQTVDASIFATTYTSSWTVFGRTQQYDLITGVTEPITAIRWWGLAFNGASGCDPSSLTYEVSFSSRNVNFPGVELVEFTTPPTITDSGYTLFGLPIYVFDLTLPEPVTLPDGEGFVSVYVQNPNGNCMFSWCSSLFGDAKSLVFNFNTLNYTNNPKDLALCLTTQPECPEGEAESTGTLKVQLIDPVQFSVITNAEVLLEGGFTSTFDPAGQLFVFECLPFGDYVININAENYISLATPLSFTDPLQFDTYFLDTPEGEPEGDCKGCAVLTTVFVTVVNNATEKALGSATVQLVGTLAEVTNNVNGVYVFPQLGDGTYTARAEAEGFVPAEVVFSVAAQATLGVTIRLDPITTPLARHSADADSNGNVSLSELLGIIQLYNAGIFSCGGDGYVVGQGSTACEPHSCDFLPEEGDFRLSLSELLRGIQIYTVRAYFPCEQGTEDGFCLGTP